MNTLAQRLRKLAALGSLYDSSRLKDVQRMLNPYAKKPLTPAIARAIVEELWERYADGLLTEYPVCVMTSSFFRAEMPKLEKNLRELFPVALDVLCLAPSALKAIMQLRSEYFSRMEAAGFKYGATVTTKLQFGREYGSRRPSNLSVTVPRALQEMLPKDSYPTLDKAEKLWEKYESEPSSRSLGGKTLRDLGLKNPYAPYMQMWEMGAGFLDANIIFIQRSPLKVPEVQVKNVKTVVR